MFQTQCYFRSRHEGTFAAIRRDYDLILALETGPDAQNLFTYRPPKGQRIALFVGNERRGLAAATRRAADAVLRIPMREQGVRSLNVASAAAVALSQLSYPGGRLPAAQGRRPALVFAQPGDPAELGSALRAAWALGWDRAGLLDSRHVWFTRDRATYVQGRGAARRHKNPLAVFPCDLDPPCPPYDLGVVVRLWGGGPSFRRTRLPLGPRTAIIVPDAGSDAADAATYTRLARTVRSVSLDLPEHEPPYPYRLITAVVLAEVARRLGWNR